MNKRQMASDGLLVAGMLISLAGAIIAMAGAIGFAVQVYFALVCAFGGWG